MSAGVYENEVLRPVGFGAQVQRRVLECWFVYCADRDSQSNHPIKGICELWAVAESSSREHLPFVLALATFGSSTGNPKI